MEHAPSGPALRVFSVVGRTIALWFRNIGSFSAITGIVLLPLAAYTALLVIRGFDQAEFETWQAIRGHATSGLMLFAAGPLTYGVIHRLRGRPAPIRSCLRAGARRLGSVLCVGLVNALVLAAPAVLIAVLKRTLIAFPVEVIALYVLCLLLVSIPAAVAERCSWTAALKRSAVLTSGVKWRIIGILLVLGLIWILVEYAVVLVTAPGAASYGVVRFDAQRLGPISTYMLGSLASTVILGSLGAIASAVTYHDLRLAKEGATIEELAKVFD